MASEAAEILVSILTPNFAAQTNQPYFTATQHYVNVSASTPLGTVIATHKAEVSVVHAVLMFDRGMSGPSHVCHIHF